jgi:hypothetical protein
VKKEKKKRFKEKDRAEGTDSVIYYGEAVEIWLELRSMRSVEGELLIENLFHLALCLVEFIQTPSL